MPRSADIVAKIRANLVTPELAQAIQKEVINETIKPLIASGTSPVEGYASGKRRFDKYKDPKKYPAKKKPKTPTNLHLTGIMLAFYKAYRVSGNILRMGIPSAAPETVKDRADGNNVGTKTKSGAVGIPARRFIPLVGETYRVSVLRKIKKVYAERIARLLSTKK